MARLKMWQTDAFCLAEMPLWAPRPGRTDLDVPL